MIRLIFFIKQLWFYIYNKYKIKIYIYYIAISKKMRNHRVYADRPQTIDMKTQIANNYIDNIAPHELMIEAINLQNKQIYALQSKYLQILSETQNAKTPSQYTEQERAKINKFELLKINQRKKFIQQGLKANQNKQRQNFEKEKNSLLQVLVNKKAMHKDMKGHQTNVFFNLDENILNELMDYAVKSEKIEESKRIKYIEEIKWWKRSLEINEKELAKSQ